MVRTRMRFALTVRSLALAADAPAIRSYADALAALPRCWKGAPPDQPASNTFAAACSGVVLGVISVREGTDLRQSLKRLHEWALQFE